MSKSIERFLVTLLLIVLVGGGCASAPRAPVTRAPAIEQATRAVAIATTCGATGSGIVIDGDSALTAAHVVATCHPPYLIQDAGGALRVATLEAVIDSDMARLRLLPGSVPFANQAPVVVTTARVGDQVCIESGGHRERRCGRVRGVGETRAGIRHTAVTLPGDSGSGLYRADGALLGVVVVCDVDSAGTCTRTGGGASPLAPVSWVTR